MLGLMSRRSVLFARSKRIEGEGAIRPPWAVSHTEFAQKCTGCGACVSACPEKILKTDEHNLARIDFSLGECTFCAACLYVCKDDALIRTEKADPWKLDVSIELECLTYAGVECRVCEDQCEPQALRFRLNAGGVSIPQLEKNLCTGCGACFAPCPVRAISIQPDTTIEGALP